MEPKQVTPPAALTPAEAVRECLESVRKLTQNAKGFEAYIGIESLEELPSVKAIFAFDPGSQVQAIREFLSRLEMKRHDERLRFVFQGTGAGRLDFSSILSRLLRRDLPFEANDLLQFLEKLILVANDYPDQHLPVQGILRAVTRFVDRNGMPMELDATLREFRKLLAVGHYVPTFADQPLYTPTGDEKKYIQHLDTLLGQTTPGITLDTAEPWAAAAQKDIDALPLKDRQVWISLLQHLHSATGTKPTKKWTTQTRAHLDAVGCERFKHFLISWLPQAILNRSDCPPITHPLEVDKNLLFCESSELILKGMAWAGSLFSEPEVAAALGDLGEACWKKVVMHGSRSRRAGNAVLWALSEIGTHAAVAQLVRINSKLKNSSSKKLAEDAMIRVVQSSGKSREDLEELAFPTFNLDANGSLARTLGNFQCTVSITTDCSAELRITDSAGKTRKTVPADIKKTHAAELNVLRRTQKEIIFLLGVQRKRLESLLRLPERSWPIGDWRARYLRHPVLSALARRLIWSFSCDGSSFPAMPYEGKLVQADGASVESLCNDKLTTNMTVRLWHPAGQSIAEVHAWRTFLESRQITQPFKQAHREVYLLTDAERRTGTYSNRFAAHVIRQHQMNALCESRGWQYRLQGSWDSGSPVPRLEFPPLNLKAEFWVEPIIGGAESLSGAGVALHVSTDQVRFYQLQPLRQLSLELVHPQVFSEVMRDVDLFVGVCSVGNDPTWSDGGPEGRYRDYWSAFSFGELSESAQTRGEVLAALLPRLAIAGQCSLDGRFLRVQGKWRAYKIHLGSGNILMEPNDQYLCIVPDQNPMASKIYLPFEGDSVLAVILSKAFLLAADDKIIDPTITRQIRPLTA